MPRDLSVIIVNYNTREHLRNCLRSLEAGSDGLSVEVVVVDNASSDGSVEMVDREFPHVRLIRNTQNVGFARACNQGAGNPEANNLLFLNSDTVIVSGAFRQLVEAADKYPEVGLIGPRLVSPRDHSLQPSFRPFPSLRTVFSQFTLLKFFFRWLPKSRWRAVMNTPTAAGWLTGACLLVRRSAWEQIGGFDETYFLYYEDTDYCRRAIRAGWKLLYTDAMTVSHQEGASIERAGQGEIRFIMFQSLFHYLSGDHSPGVLRLGMPCFKLLALLTACLTLVESGTKTVLYQWIRMAWKAERHRRRWVRNKEFLSRHLWDFLKL